MLPHSVYSGGWRFWCFCHVLQQQTLSSDDWIFFRKVFKDIFILVSETKCLVDPGIHSAFLGKENMFFPLPFEWSNQVDITFQSSSKQVLNLLLISTFRSLRLFRTKWKTFKNMQKKHWLIQLMKLTSQFVNTTEMIQIKLNSFFPAVNHGCCCLKSNV